MANATKTKKAKENSGHELALPGEGKLSSEMVDAAVADLNRIYVTKGLETARAVGNYVLEKFFGGDAGTFRERGNGHVSFRQLAKREDLRVGWQFIWNAVAVVEQMPEIGTEIGEALPFSHHKLLLGVKDKGKKLTLATTAVKEGLGKRDLEDLVKATRKADDGESKAGRPPLPAFVKAFTVLKKAVDIAEGEEISEASFEHFSKEQAKALLTQVEAHIAALNAVAADVRAYAGA